ncbi:MAG: hypothetical protein WC025_03490 [Candidatus Magasanikbacteria bacterium]
MKKEKFENFIDTSGDFANSSLKQAKFFLEHKILFRKIFIGILLAWCIFSTLFGLFFWGKYFLFDYQTDNQNIYNMVNTGVSHDTIQRNKPVDLQIFDKYIFSSSKDKYDFALELVNPNKFWVATLVYHFSYENGQTENKTAILLPGVQRFLTEFGVESPNFVPANIQFQVVSTSWKRLDAHTIADPLDYISERVNFSIDNIKFNSFGSLESGVGRLLGFDVINNTLFGFKSANFVVVLRRSGVVVGLTPLYITNFKSLSSQNIIFSLFNNNLEVDSVELQPVLDVFDDSIYL